MMFSPLLSLSVSSESFGGSNFLALVFCWSSKGESPYFILLSGDIGISSSFAGLPDSILDTA